VDAEAAGRYRPWDDLAGQIYIGSKQFRAEVEAKIRPLEPRGVPRSQLWPARPTPKEIADALEEVVGPFEATRGGRSKARRLYASLLQSEGLLTNVTNVTNVTYVTYVTMAEPSTSAWAPGRRRSSREAARRLRERIVISPGKPRRSASASTRAP